jgi:NAD(P)H-dependent FMN reductase
MVDKKISIVAISGSIRPHSSNRAVIDVAQACLGDRVDFTVYESIDKLPFFNDSKEDIPEVTNFRDTLKWADGILLCSPEYAFGVPGVLKNALEWTVATGELGYKPVALITAATGGDKAHASLLLTLSALSANVAEDAKLLISFIRAKMNAAGLVTDEATLQAIYVVADALVRVIKEQETVNE